MVFEGINVLRLFATVGADAMDVLKRCDHAAPVVSDANIPPMKCKEQPGSDQEDNTTYQKDS
jgi:hypothetical protein